MPAKNHKQWLADPPLQPGEWVDSRVYSDPRIFEDELKNIFRRTWIPVCHESELPNLYDFRTTASRSSYAAVPTTKCARFSTCARIAA